MVNDNNLVRELKNKNMKALDYLVDNYSDLILRISYSVLNNRELSEECVNEVIWKVWKGIRHLKNNEDKFKKWLMILTKNTAIDILRKEVRHGDNVSIDNAINIQGRSLDDEVDEHKMITVLKNEIDNMEDKNREIFKRRFFKGHTVKEIGKDMGLSESSISNRIFKEKKRIISILRGGEK